MARSPKTKGKEGRDRTLGLARLDDVHAKLVWETQQFMRWQRSPRRPNHPAMYMAQNAASTAWNMGDWLAAELDFEKGWEKASRLTGRSLKGIGSLQEWMREDMNLRSCQQIALAVKHVTLAERAYEADFQTVDQVFDIYARFEEDGHTIAEGHAVPRQLSVHQAVWLEGAFRGMYDMNFVLLGAVTWWRDVIANLRE
ncbi:hypothetical protein [Dyella caseinilytica]|uniref:Uncharacterized protein n=1 Tax=Dyella caseinilytica TaxID=1849581 RepID=A0ABX7GPV6_9GAMM|nr:hypothetical protein [Dyella caseinilytica]QRN52433.1 hypothetical protein ISN74_13200 [Dyella caseinilytica]GGA05949.1 hypothetical protein GCM10011408_28610 [Dyella caseinilytica]